MIRNVFIAFVTGQAIAVALLHGQARIEGRQANRDAERLAAMAALAEHCEPYAWPYIPQECQWRDETGDKAPWLRETRLVAAPGGT